MRTHFKLTSSLVIGLVLTGCAGSQSDSSSSMNCTSERFCQTSQNIEVDKTGVVESYSAGSQQKVGAMGLLDPVLSLTPVLTLVATLAPPTIGSQALQASDITVNGAKIYVSYNVAGEVQAGGIDVIDATFPYSPVLKSEVLYPNADIHKVAIDGSNLYAVGATSAGNAGAMLYRVALDSAGLLTSTKTEVSLHRAADAEPAFAGVGVKATLSNLYVVSGSNGGLSILNKSTLAETNFTAVENARDVALSAAGDVYVVTGKTDSEEARVKRFNPTTGAIVSATNITLPGARIDDGKASIITGGTFQVATAGFGGAKLMCLDNNGTVYGTMANPTLPGLTDDLQVANAAAYGNGLIYVANGEAGVSIYSVERTTITVGCIGHSIQYRGRFSVGPGVSANNVYWAGGFLVVATGKGGFQMIQVTQSLVAGLLQIL